MTTAEATPAHIFADARFMRGRRPRAHGRGRHPRRRRKSMVRHRSSHRSPCSGPHRSCASDVHYRRPQTAVPIRRRQVYRRTRAPLLLPSGRTPRRMFLPRLLPARRNRAPHPRDRRLHPRRRTPSLFPLKTFPQPNPPLSLSPPSVIPAPSVIPTKPGIHPQQPTSPTIPPITTQPPPSFLRRQESIPHNSRLPTSPRRHPPPPSFPRSQESTPRNSRLPQQTGGSYNGAKTTIV